VIKKENPEWNAEILPGETRASVPLILIFRFLRWLFAGKGDPALAPVPVR